MSRVDIRDSLIKAIHKSFGGIEVPNFSIEAPENPTHGDYATNAALILAKMLKKQPLDIAQKIVDQLPTVTYKSEVVTPGFINFRLRPEALYKEFGSILRQKERYGRSSQTPGRDADGQADGCRRPDRSDDGAAA